MRAIVGLLLLGLSGVAVAGPCEDMLRLYQEHAAELAKPDSNPGTLGRLLQRAIAARDKCLELDAQPGDDVAAALQALGEKDDSLYGQLRDRLGNMKRAEFDRLTALWSASTFPTLRASLEFHVRKHGGNDLARYLRQAGNFRTKGLRKIRQSDGSEKWLKGNGEFVIKRGGKIVTYGRN